MKPASMITIKDIQNELGCSIDRATEIMHYELPHINIAGPASKRPCWGPGGQTSTSGSTAGKRSQGGQPKNDSPENT